MPPKVFLSSSLAAVVYRFSLYTNAVTTEVTFTSCDHYQLPTALAIGITCWLLVVTKV